MSIKFKIVTPEKTVSEEEIYQVTLPIEGGEVTLLPDHMPYIGSLQAGEILLRHEINGEATLLATSGGFVEFHDNTLVVLADTAERAACSAPTSSARASISTSRSTSAPAPMSAARNRR